MQIENRDLRFGFDRLALPEAVETETEGNNRADEVKHHRKLHHR